MSKQKCIITCKVIFLIAYHITNGLDGSINVEDCPPNKFICQPYNICCLKDSQFCSKRSETCEDVFTKNEDKHEVCCRALSTSDMTRNGLIEACKYRLGSDTWFEYCKGKYLSTPQVETSSSAADVQTTVAPTHDQQDDLAQKDDPKTVINNAWFWVAIILLIIIIFGFIYIIFRKEISRYFDRFIRPRISLSNLLRKEQQPLQQQERDPIDRHMLGNAAEPPQAPAEN